MPFEHFDAMAYRAMRYAQLVGSSREAVQPRDSLEGNERVKGRQLLEVDGRH
jgi:hypothetical protein